MAHAPRHSKRRPDTQELSDCFRRACNHDAGALQQLLALYRGLLLKLAYQRLEGPLRTKVAPSDLVQTTVWKATQAFPSERFDNQKGFVAWLVTILKNEAADIRRRYGGAQKRDVSRERPLHAAEVQQWLNQLSATLSGGDATQFQTHETMERLSSAMARLPSHYQLVLHLRYFQKLTFPAIGVQLERSADAARVLHNRALARLRKELPIDTGSHAGEPGPSTKP